MLNRVLRLFLALIASSIFFTSALAQTLPDWGAGLTPAQTRELNSRFDALRSQFQVRESVLRSIASTVDPNLEPLSFEDLIARVEASVERAASLEIRIRQLSVELQSVRNASQREISQNLLAKAEQSYSEGNFSEAESLFLEIGRLGGANTGTIHSAWISALDSAADAAFLQGREIDLERARSIKLEALRTTRALGEQLLLEAWQLAVDAMSISRQKYIRYGDIDDLVVAMEIYEHDIKPLTKQVENERLLFKSVLEGARAFLMLDEVAGGNQELQAGAFEALAGLVLRAPDHADVIDVQDIVDAHFLLSNVTLRLADRMEGDDRSIAIGKAIKFMEASSNFIKFGENRFSRAEWGYVHGTALMAIARDHRMKGDIPHSLINFIGADASFAFGIELLNPETEPMEWARLRNLQCLAKLETATDFRTTDDRGFGVIVEAIEVCEEATLAIGVEDSAIDWWRYVGTLGLAHLAAADASEGEMRSSHLRDAKNNLDSSIESLEQLRFQDLRRLELAQDRMNELYSELEDH